MMSKPDYEIPRNNEFDCGVKQPRDAMLCKVVSFGIMTKW